MKKFFSFLLITFLLACNLKYTPSYASAVPLPNWSDPGITEIINLSDLTGWMQNGGVFDVSNFQDAEEFLTWYYQIRVPYIDENGKVGTAPAFGNSTFNFVPGNSSYSDITNPRGVITNAFREHTGYGRTFQSDYEKYALTGGNLIDMPFQLQDRRSIANFNLYKYDSLTDFVNNFVTDEPVTPVYPDQNYVTYLNNINGTGFWWSDYPRDCGSFEGDGLLLYPCDTYSWFTDSSGGIPVNPSYVGRIYCTDAISIYIWADSDPNVGYYFTITIPGTNVYYNFKYNANEWKQMGAIQYNVLKFDVASTSDFSNSTFYFGYGGSLASIFDYIQNHFRNVNIYVEGVAWSLIGQQRTPPAPEFPDVVGGEEIPVQTWPLHIPKAPAYINGTGLLNAIQHAIDTDGEFDFGDLVGNITDEDGHTLTDGDFITVPVGDTMPNPNPDPYDVTGTPTPPVPDPDTIPVLPGPIHDAFTGTTILAELVDATQTALPDELITVFWGILFILFILGIIKILHK